MIEETWKRSRLAGHVTRFKMAESTCAYASINVKPEGGGPWANVGHLTSIAFPTHGNLTKNLCPGGDVCFFCAEEWDQVTSYHALVCASVILEIKYSCF